MSGQVDSVQTVRQFSRFYTRKIGALKRGLLDSPYALPEARVLYEIAQRPRVIASDLCRELDLDRGYMSRLLARLDKYGLLDRQTATDDARRTHLRLSSAGRAAFADLDNRSSRQAAGFVEHLSPADRRNLAEHLNAAVYLLSRPDPASRSELILRQAQPGDFGWIVQRHGALYFEEYGWDSTFEGLVAQIVADYLRKHDPACERGWIAECAGHRVGSILLVSQSAKVAQLRLLFVEPSARGQGVGGRLIAECLEFARASRYRQVDLWTVSSLHAARHLYEKAGFRLLRSKSSHHFGHALTDQYWSLALID